MKTKAAKQWESRVSELKKIKELRNGVKYTHLLTSRDWHRAYYVAVVGGRLHYKILRTGEVGEFVTGANSVEALYGDNAAVVITPLNKFTGNI